MLNSAVDELETRQKEWGKNMKRKTDFLANRVSQLENTLIKKINSSEMNAFNDKAMAKAISLQDEKNIEHNDELFELRRKGDASFLFRSAMKH